MYILILMVIIIALGFIFLKQLDQRRWKRYQIDRDLFFRQNPYQLQQDTACVVAVAMTKTAQFKLRNELMLKTADERVLKTALIQRMPSQSHHQYIIRVSIEEVLVGYLDKVYAARFCLQLQDTDFFIGRPIAVQAQVSFVTQHQGCIVRLNLVADPYQMSPHGLHEPTPIL